MPAKLEHSTWELPPRLDAPIAPDDLAADATGVINATSSMPRPALLGEPNRLGPYHIQRKLGAGGMGAVYLAINEKNGQEVALKVMSRESLPDDYAVNRFKKESRLLSEVQHPHVTNLLEVGEEDGTCYLVMEYVNGIDLKRVLGLRKPLDEQLSLKIVRCIAEALSGAHTQGIVHRDIKPANILIAGTNSGCADAETNLLETLDAGREPIIKLTDFGLARHMEQSASLDLTRTGAMLGTPYYIAPEQCSDSGKIRPETDIYSLGATLFEMLAGRPPFLSTDPVKLITQHCFEPPPDIRKINSSVSDGVSRVLTKMLQKRPEERYADASHLLAEVHQILSGVISQVEMHPHLPVTAGPIAEAHWEWDLHANADQLWPFVSNTERINCAAGVPPVEYRMVRDPQGPVRKFGSFRLGFSTLSWEEHPFEWVEGRRLGVLREFQKGPFYWFASIVELCPLPQGGTRLKHTVRIATRGLIGRLIAAMELNIKGRRSLDRIYQRIDSVVSGELMTGGLADPFVAAAAVSQVTHRRLIARRDELSQLALSVTCLDRFMRFLEESPAQGLARIRPFALAESLDVDPTAMFEVCLRACEAGLLELHWDILCPTCRVSASVKDTLKEIESHTRCEACDLDFEVDFRQAVELIFRVHPEIRQSDLKTYCIGGPEHAPHVVAQTRLAPSETLELDLSLDPGTYTLRGPQLPYAVNLVVQRGEGSSRLLFPLSSDFDAQRSFCLQGQRQILILENQYASPLLLRLERTVSRPDVMTAAQAAQNPLFRRLFPEELLSREKLSDYSTCSLLAVKINSFLDLFERWGDAGAFQLISSRFREVRNIIERNGGQIVKENDDRLLAAFKESIAAAECAAELLNRPGSAEDAQRGMSLRVGLHRGTALSTTMNGRVDYYGRTVSTAAGLVELPGHESLVLSPEFAQDNAAMESLQRKNFPALAPFETAVPQNTGYQIVAARSSESKSISSDEK